MPSFLIPILTLTGLGFFFGLVLTFASKKFAVTQDPRIQKILDNLPGANCGACGRAGCAAFGDSLVKGELPLDSCKICSEDQAKEIAGILGIKVATKTKQIITLRCHGGKNAKDKFTYDGLKDCSAAASVLGGYKLCDYACLGFGNCARACSFGAIKMSGESLPVIDDALCTGCGRCVMSCPRNLMVLIPDKAKVYVGCTSADPTKVVARVCSVGCIACRKCEKVCPTDAIHVIDNLAVIDYEKCISCKKCIKECPRNIIKKRK